MSTIYRAVMRSRSLLPSRHLTIYRTFTASPQAAATEHAAPIEKSEYAKEHPSAVYRACGVPQTSGEAGPAEPGEILKPALGIGAAIGGIVAALMWYYSPWNPHTAAGKRVGDKLLEERREIEVKEGLQTEHETVGQRKEEDKYRESHKNQPHGNFR